MKVLPQAPVSLQDFPFDADGIELHIHQNEQSSRDEYLLRAYETVEEEQTSVSCSFTGSVDCGW